MLQNSYCALTGIPCTFSLAEGLPSWEPLKMPEIKQCIRKVATDPVTVFHPESHVKVVFCNYLNYFSHTNEITS